MMRCARAHADWLLDHMPGAEARELPGGHVLDQAGLYGIYQWLLTS
jgi:hypothetical protein